MPKKEKYLDMFTFYSHNTKRSAVVLHNNSDIGHQVTYSLLFLNHCYQKRTGLVTSLGFQEAPQVPDEYTHFIFAKGKE